MTFSFPLTQTRAEAHLRVGREGEALAKRYIHALGYELRGSNIRVGRGEIDLLAFDPTDQVLVFLEVKSRAHRHAEYRPELNLTFRKRTSMAKAAREWIAANTYEGGYRMDLLCIAGGKVTDHMKELEWE